MEFCSTLRRVLVDSVIALRPRVFGVDEFMFVLGYADHRFREQLEHTFVFLRHPGLSGCRRLFFDPFISSHQTCFPDTYFPDTSPNDVSASDTSASDPVL